MKNIYHNECSCLFAHNIKDDKCMKRYFIITDWRTNEDKGLFVCSDYLRCRINKLREADYRYVDEYKVTQIINDIFNEYVDCKGSSWNMRPSNDLLEKDIYFTVCDRPYSSHTVNIKEVMEQYLDSDYGGDHLYHPLKLAIVEYMEKLTYKKYKTKYKSIIIKVNKLRHTWGEEKRTLFNEIILEIFETQIKIKKQI